MRRLATLATKTVATVVIIAGIFAPGTPLPVHNAEARIVSVTASACTGMSGTILPADEDGSGNVPTQGQLVRCYVEDNPDPTKAYQNDPGVANRTGGLNGTAADDIGCSLSGANGIAFCVSNLIYVVTVGLGTYFAYIAGYVFSFAIFLALNSASYAVDLIAQFWTYARDIANMSFIFILLYIGFKIMFQAETTGTIRMLAWVVVIALLVNFSFLLTRVVIDTGNILAVQFYNSIDTTVGKGSNPDPNYGYLPQIGNQRVKDLSAPIMSGIRVHTLFNSEAFKNYYTSIKDQTGSAMTLLITLSVIYIAVGVILFIIAASLLFAGAKLLIRVIGLWGVIIASPIAFVLAIFRADKEANSWGVGFTIWLKYLLHFSLYPAVYLFVFLLLANLMNQFALSGSLLDGIFRNAQSAATGVGGNGISLASIGISIAEVVIRLGFVVALLYGALSLADKVAGFTNGAAGWFQKSVLSGAAGGFVGRFGRGTFGVAGSVGAWNQRRQGPRTGETEEAFKKRVDSSLWTGMSKRTYDLRNAPIIGAPLTKGLGAITRGSSVLASKGGLPVNFGEAKKPETEEDQQKRIAARQEVNATAREEAGRRGAVGALYQAARRENQDRRRAVGQLYAQHNEEGIEQRQSDRAAATGLFNAVKIEKAARQSAVGQLYTQKVDEDITKQIAGRKSIDSLYKSAQLESASKAATPVPASPVADNGVFQPAGVSRPTTSAPAQSVATPASAPASTPATTVDNGVFQPAGASRPAATQSTVTNVTNNITNVTNTTQVASRAPVTGTSYTPPAPKATVVHQEINTDKLATELNDKIKQGFGKDLFKIVRGINNATTPPSNTPPAAPAAARPVPSTSTDVLGSDGMKA